MSFTPCQKCGAPLTVREGSPCTNTSCEDTGVWSDGGAVARAIQDAPKPLTADTTEFGKWLRGQRNRRDPVGQLARVAAQDPHWPCPESRQETANYFLAMHARPFVLKTSSIAWDEYDLSLRRTASRAKAKAAKQARKKQRKTKR